MRQILSTLTNATDGCITYYVGNKFEHLQHLSNCKVYCKKGVTFDVLRDSSGVEFIEVDDPQLEFYKLSTEYPEDYLDNENLVFNKQYNAYIHKNATIGKNVKIGPASVIAECVIEDNVEIHSNVTVYAKSIIKSGTTIESNTVIGAKGVMWVWDEEGNRIYLTQLGNVVIEENCFIGTNVTLVRGSVNETTKIGKNTCIAHGTKVGHGSNIGEYNHFANNVSVGGSAKTAKYCFFGSGSSISPGTKISVEILVGAGGVIRGNISRPGVYAGVPAVWKKSLKGKLSGVPTWKKTK